MKETDDFKKYYKEKMLPLLAPLEKNRDEVCLKTTTSATFITMGVIAAGIIIIMTTIILTRTPGLSVLIIPLSIIISVLMGKKIKNDNVKKSIYYNNFEKEVINSLINFLGNEYIYSPSEKISEAKFRDSRLYELPSPLTDTSYFYKSSSVVKYEQKGLFEFYCSEFHSYRRIIIDPHNSESLYESPYIHGLFFVITFYRKFRYNSDLIKISGKTDREDLFLPPCVKRLYELSGTKEMRLQYIKNEIYMSIALDKALLITELDTSLLKVKEMNSYYSCMKHIPEMAKELIKTDSLWDSPKIYERICPFCKKVNLESNKFCNFCGKTMEKSH